MKRRVVCASGRLRGGVAGVVLAGGRSRRTGGRDKGLLKHRGEPLAAAAIRTLAPRCRIVVVSANRHLSRYRQLAAVVVTDEVADYPGPLAGIRAALRAVRPGLLLTCPCDAPGLDPRVPVRLLRALRLAPGAEVAVLHEGERLQPLLLALRGSTGTSIDEYLAAGGRSVHGWLATRRCVQVRMAVRIANRNRGPAGFAALRNSADGQEQ